jgi:hypothetical protein
MAVDNGDFVVKISVCENMPDDKVIILCHPSMRDTVDNMLAMVQDKIEEDGEDIIED